VAVLESHSSPLATYYNLAKYYNKTRKDKNGKVWEKPDTITIHMTCGSPHLTEDMDSVEDLKALIGKVKGNPVKTAKDYCDYFHNIERQASSNYNIGDDGSIGISVPEHQRSICSSSTNNDARAVTIEVSSSTKYPYNVTKEAYAALIDLLVDICKRNSIKQLIWSPVKDDRVNHRNGCNMTMHKDLKTTNGGTACPGKYLEDRQAQIAAAVNSRLIKISVPGAPSITIPSDSIHTDGNESASGNTDKEPAKVPDATPPVTSGNAVINPIPGSAETELGVGSSPEFVAEYCYDQAEIITTSIIAVTPNSIKATIKNAKKLSNYYWHYRANTLDNTKELSDKITIKNNECEFTIKNLQANTPYFIEVFVKDATGVERLLHKQLACTSQSRPESIKELKLALVDSEDNEKYAEISFNEPSYWGDAGLNRGYLTSILLDGSIIGSYDDIIRYTAGPITKKILLNDYIDSKQLSFGGAIQIGIQAFTKINDEIVFDNSFPTCSKPICMTKSTYINNLFLNTDTNRKVIMHVL
jgi:hypothetical protein